MSARLSASTSRTRDESTRFPRQTNWEGGPIDASIVGRLSVPGRVTSGYGGVTNDMPLFIRTDAVLAPTGAAQESRNPSPLMSTSPDVLLAVKGSSDHNFTFVPKPVSI